jgi:hypothetical protein
VVLSKFRMDTAVVGGHLKGGHLNCGFVIPASCERGSIFAVTDHREIPDKECRE